MRDNAWTFAAGAVIVLLGLVAGAAAAADAEIPGVRMPESWPGTVIARTLNVRAGPGEGYPVVGTLKRGDRVTAVDEQNDWVRLTGSGDGDTQVWAYRRFLSLPDDFMAPALGDAENAFVDWAASRGDLEEFSIDSRQRLSIVFADPVEQTAAAAVAREIGCAWRERMRLVEPVTVTVWPDTGPLGGWLAQATCP